MALQKEELEMPVPYWLHHNVELKAPILRVKHCLGKGCSHFVFVKKVWTAPQKEVINLG